jgi:hypothetical protein
MDELVATCRTGRKYLPIIGGELVPRLVALDALVDNPHFSPADALRYGVPVVTVDVQAAIDQFRGAIQDFQAASFAKKARNRRENRTSDPTARVQSAVEPEPAA